MKLIKEIRAKNGDLHFRRWGIFQSKYFNIYLHQIYIEDREGFQHSHPWNFLCLILKGGYIEQRGDKLKTVKPGNFIWANRYQFHKIKQLLSKESISLFFTFGERQNWFFRTSMGDIESRRYFALKNNKKDK